MKQLLGDEPLDENKLTATMRGLISAIICMAHRPNEQQMEQVNALLVAWHLTQAWLPGDVGYAQRLQATQASPASAPTKVVKVHARGLSCRVAQT